MKFKMMYSFLNTDLQLIEKELEAAIEADSSVLREASLHLLQENPPCLCFVGSEIWKLRYPYRQTCGSDARIDSHGISCT